MKNFKDEARMVFVRRGKARRESFVDFQGLSRSMAEIRPLQLKCFYRSLVLKATAALFGQLEGGALGTGAVLGGGAAGAHLNGGQGADALGTVVVGAAGDGALDAVVGVHLIHRKRPPL